MESKAIMKGKTLSVQVHADETKSSVLWLENLLINGILQENRMQGSIEIKCLKNKKTANWGFKVHMQHDSCLDSKPADLLCKSMSTSVWNCYPLHSHLLRFSTWRGGCVSPFLNQFTEIIWLVFFKA